MKLYFRIDTDGGISAYPAKSEAQAAVAADSQQADYWRTLARVAELLDVLVNWCAARVCWKAPPCRVSWPTVLPVILVSLRSTSWKVILLAVQPSKDVTAAFRQSCPCGVKS